MPTKRISREQFNRRLSFHQALERLTGKEVEWFAAKPGGLLGTVAKGRGGWDLYWNYVIFMEQRKDVFTVCNVKANFLTEMPHGLISCLGWLRLQKTIT